MTYQMVRGNAILILGGNSMKTRGNVTVVLDAQAGSCGKGKFIGYLACKDKPDIAINNFMSNAGHTFVTITGQKIMTQHLPTSIVNQSTQLMIGPGAAITPEIFIKELISYHGMIGDRAVMVHPRAMIIKEKHRKQEKELIRSGSTFKGCGTSQAEKIVRAPGVELFADWWTPNNVADVLLDAIGKNSYAIQEVTDIMNMVQIMDTGCYINDSIDCDEDVLIEGSQGFDLDINYGLNYPHTTSRQCHAGQLVADCGISPKLVDDIIMIMRPYPIRISNQTELGINISSGDYDGADETTWDIVKKRCGAPDNIEFGEMTTVTKKMRRVFEMNWNRLKYAAQINRPTQIALNFAQYIDWDILNCTKPSDITSPIKDFINKIEHCAGCPVTMIGTGPQNNHIIDLRSQYDLLPKR